MTPGLFDLVGVGIGPFNLSLAALLAPLQRKRLKFLDNKAAFSWHDELMFGDARMQTSYLKDLVTPVDPTNPHSFLNYLVSSGQFYHFLNTDRKTVTRIEFNRYCQWVAEKLGEMLGFDSAVDDVRFEGEHFTVHSRSGVYRTRHLCVASGPLPNVPDCAQAHLSQDVFHAKSPAMRAQDFSGKRVVIVGGGQTGVEIFRNALAGRWGRARKVTLVTGRESLRPLDEGPFTNEIFTPDFVTKFYALPQKTKDEFTRRLLLASDGNTPEYLHELYNELYMDRFYLKSMPDFEIRPMRWMVELARAGDGHAVQLRNLMDQGSEMLAADKVVLATGFSGGLPSFLDSLKGAIDFDGQGRPVIDRSYRLKTAFSANHIYAMNFSRHGHGIADPQTSLMSWRSAVIANQVLEEEVYRTEASVSSLLNFYEPQEGVLQP